MDSVCDLKILVNQEHEFYLNADLVQRSGSLMKLIRRCEAEKDRDSDESDCESTMRVSERMHVSVENVPGGSETFELAARFCYNDGDIVITSSNVARLRCIAEMLEMTEDYGKANLLRRTESFLKNVVFLSWHEGMIVLGSCEALLPYPESSDLVARCVEALAKIIDSQSAAWPGNTSPTGSSAAMEANRPSTASDSSYMSKSSASRRFWWFQDLCGLSIFLVEKFVKALMGRGMEHKVLSRFLLHYIRKALPVLGQNSVSPLVPFSGSLCPSPKRKASEEQQVMSNCSQAVQCEILEVVVSLLTSLEDGASSCKTLFGLLRVAFVLDASDACKKQVEKKIGSQLDTATLDNILVPSLPARASTPLYDVDLVLRLVEHFLQDRQAVLESPIVAANKKADNGFLTWLFDSHKDSFRLVDDPFGVQRSLNAVGDLIDKYLSEVAADVHLQPSKFESLAGVLPDFARRCHDGLYRAIDIYLESHPYMTESEAVNLCGVLNCHKLSMETCKHLTKNRTFPPWVSLQVLLAQQMQLRAAVQGCHCNNKNKKKKFFRINNSSALVGKMFTSTTHIADSDAEDYSEEDVEPPQSREAAKVDLRAIQSKVDELEKLCKRMRTEMAKHNRARRRLIC